MPSHAARAETNLSGSHTLTLRIRAEPDEEVEAFARRPLDPPPYCHNPHRKGTREYGRNPYLRRYLGQQQVGNVMAVSAADRLDTPRGPVAMKELAALVLDAGWQELSAGAGAKGERFHDWALIDDRADSDGVRWVLIRRHRTSGELAYFRCYAPGPVPLSRLVAVAGRRWRIEESFAQGKCLAGLDEHQVRTWTSWHRWSLLAMVATRSSLCVGPGRPATGRFWMGWSR